MKKYFKTMTINQATINELKDELIKHNNLSNMHDLKLSLIQRIFMGLDNNNFSEYKKALIENVIKKAENLLNSNIINSTDPFLILELLDISLFNKQDSIKPLLNMTNGSSIFVKILTEKYKNNDTHDISHYKTIFENFLSNQFSKINISNNDKILLIKSLLELQKRSMSELGFSTTFPNINSIFFDNKKFENDNIIISENRVNYFQKDNLLYISTNPFISIFEDSEFFNISNDILEKCLPLCFKEKEFQNRISSKDIQLHHTQSPLFIFKDLTLSEKNNVINYILFMESYIYDTLINTNNLDPLYHSNEYTFSYKETLSQLIDVSNKYLSKKIVKKIK